MTDLVKRAAEFAERAHRGQPRKYYNIPYIVHPARVAGMLARMGVEEEVIAAAWLHDVLEDTPATYEELFHRFGQDVADLVRYLTNPSKQYPTRVLNRADRKKIDREHIGAAPREAQLIKLCDRLDNLLDMDGADTDFKTIYADESILLAEAINVDEAWDTGGLKHEVIAAAQRLKEKKT